MLRQHQASLDDKKKFTALVKDLFPAQAKNVNLLLMAYNMGIAQDIRKATDINNTFAFRYVKQVLLHGCLPRLVHQRISSRLLLS